MVAMIEQNIQDLKNVAAVPNRRKKKALYNRVNRRELKERLRQSDEKRITLSFYRYSSIAAPQALRDELYAWWDEMGVLGRTYVAHEGINAQISVPEARYADFKSAMESYPLFKGMRYNVAVEADGKSFFALIIKLRDKIVADGIDDPTFNPADCGEHLNAENWNKMSEDPDVIIVDMRNCYESEVGHFDGAILPDATTFREELPLVAGMLSDKKDKKIMMYCTGGIRCEKASAYLKHQGFKNVFQLEGGIIEYDRQVRAYGLQNKFKGKNFVFDERLGERISPDVIAHCHQCGAPCDDHANCANDHCHLLFIQCPTCREQYSGCCSVTCRDFCAMPESERARLAGAVVFNGSKFGRRGLRN